MEASKIPKSKLLIRDLVGPLSGFFSTILNPIYSDYWNNSDIDLRFFTEYANRTISPVLEYYVEKIPNAQNVEEWGITTANKTLLAEAFYKQFYRNWKHLLQINDIIDTEDWSPLYNYELHVKTDKTEFTPGAKETIEQLGSEKTAIKGKETRGESGTEKDTIRGDEITTDDGSETTAYKGKETTSETGKETDKASNKRNTFNSVTPLDTDSSENEREFTNRKSELEFTNRENELSFKDREHKLSYNNRENEKSFTNRKSELEYTDRENELSFNNRKQEKSYTGKDTTEHTKDEYGSLGVSSAADQVLKNIEAMKKVDLAGYIVTDLAKFLTIPLYDVQRFRYRDYE